MRLRSQGTYTESTKVENFYTTKVKPYPFVLSGTLYGLAIGNHKVMADVVTPHFDKRKKQGKFIFNPLSIRERIQERVASADLVLRAKNPWSNQPLLYTSWKYQGDRAARSCQYYLDDYGNKLFPMPDLFGSSEVEDMVLEAETAMLSDRGRGDANLFETIAEYEQILSLVPNALSSFASILASSLKVLYSFTGKALIRSMSKGSKDVAGAYLLYRYGAKPLVADLVAVLEALSTELDYPYVTTRSKIDEERKRDVVVGTGCDPVEDVVATVSQRVIVRVTGVDRLTTSAISHALGLTGKNLLTLKWELIPFSFVVDWFINVGDFLGAYAPNIGYESLGSCTVVQKSSTADLYMTPPTLPESSTWGFVISSTRPKSEFRIVTNEKTRGPVSTTGGLTFKRDFRFSKATRILDALALIRQSFK